MTFLIGMHISTGRNCALGVRINAYACSTEISACEKPISFSTKSLLASYGKIEIPRERKA